MTAHSETRILPWSPEQMFDLVAAVDRYPEFLPWCLAARIRRREGEVFWADLVIGFKVFRETFTSRVATKRAEAIDVELAEGPFRHLVNRWRFHPHDEGGCRVEFHVEFEFRSRVLQAAIGALFDEATRRMISAFTKRAEALYGQSGVRQAAS